MTEFERWWKKIETQIPLDTYSGCVDDDMMKAIARCTWKCALEFIAGNADGSCGVRRCLPMESIRDEIGLGLKETEVEKEAIDIEHRVNFEMSLWSRIKAASLLWWAIVATGELTCVGEDGDEDGDENGERQDVRVEVPNKDS